MQSAPVCLIRKVNAAISARYCQNVLIGVPIGGSKGWASDGSCWQQLANLIAEAGGLEALPLVAESERWGAAIARLAAFMPSA